MLVKAYLIRKDQENDDSERVYCLFNPKEFNVEKGNQFAEVNIPGLSSPLLQFVRGNARSVTMDLFFDTYEIGEDVRFHTDRITGWDAGSMLSKLSPRKGLMDIDSNLHAPPICIFIWGKFRFQCVIERVTKRFTMFHPEGFPVRATLNVTLKEYKEVDVQVQELNLQSADLTKRRVVKGDERLCKIAFEEYGSTEDWRLIANANNIDNPRILSPGQELIIPAKG